MAYSYDDFTSAATNAGLMMRSSVIITCTIRKAARVQKRI